MSTQSTTGGATNHAPAQPEAFPYETLLAYYHGDLAPEEAARIVAEVNQNKRWRAHFDSVRYLDLERAAAQFDAEALGHFKVADGTEFCREAARTNGEVFLRFLDGSQESAQGHSRKEWDRHVNSCVYCRRMRRLMQARFVCDTHDVPKGEKLLRERLLEEDYRDALDRVTADLTKPIRVGSSPEHNSESWISAERGLTLVLHRVPTRFLPLLDTIVRHLIPRVTYTGRAPRIPDVMEYLTREDVLARLRDKAGVHNTLGPVVAEFFCENGCAEASDVLSTFAPDRIKEVEAELRLTITHYGRIAS